MATADVYGIVAGDLDLVLGLGSPNKLTSLLVRQKDQGISTVPFYFSPLAQADSEQVVVVHLSFLRGSHSRFTLQWGTTYLGIKGVPEGRTYQGVAVALVNYPATLRLGYNSVDNHYHPNFFVGAPVSLQCRYRERWYDLTWPGGHDLISALPLAWYQYDKKLGRCTRREGLPALLDNLARPEFRGYTERNWCELHPNITYCEGQYCGSCLGRCSQLGQYCQGQRRDSWSCVDPTTPSAPEPLPELLLGILVLLLLLIIFCHTLATG